MTDHGLSPDPWIALRQHTGARIALGRAGGSLPTAEVLKFALDHAEARDAVNAEFELDTLQQQLAGLRLPCVRVETMVKDRTMYLVRPDLGRKLDDPSRQKLQLSASESVEPCDIALIIADGLCARAAQTYAAPLLAALVPSLQAAGHHIGPLVLARHARVAVQDDIAVALGATAAIILLGERPGLHAPVSLGAYFVYHPTVGTTDERRNCVSNIRTGGLSPTDAAETLAYLTAEAFRRQLSGVNLKDARSAGGLVLG